MITQDGLKILGELVGGITLLTLEADGEDFKEISKMQTKIAGMYFLYSNYWKTKIKESEDATKKEGS